MPQSDEQGITQRDGSHQASFYNSNGCAGHTVNFNQEFGCDGTCYNFNGAAYSVMLKQANKGGKKPTADIFSDDSCEKKIKHAGIFNGENSGCTNFGGQGRSYRVYYGC